MSKDFYNELGQAEKQCLLAWGWSGNERIPAQKFTKELRNLYLYLQKILDQMGNILTNLL